MEYYWPMGVSDDGEISWTSGSSVTKQEYLKCFKVWEKSYHKNFLAKWVDVQEDDVCNTRRIYLKEFIPRKIYFDMDGVIVDFEGGVKELLGIEPRPQGYHPDYDNQLFEAMSKYDHFYRNLKPIKGSIEMVKKVIEKHGVDNVEILTGVPKPERNIPQASDDKKEWVATNISPDIKVHAVLRKNKTRFAKSVNHVLIDDYEANVKAWRKAGGTAIHFNGNIYDRNNKVIEYLNIV